MTDKNERIQILEMIKSGVITAEEGARLLQALDEDDRLEDNQEDSQGSFSGDVIDDDYHPDIDGWKRYWAIPLWIGVGITIAGSLLMLWVYQTTGFSFWFACTWFPFLLGVVGLLIGQLPFSSLVVSIYSIFASVYQIALLSLAFQAITSAANLASIPVEHEN